MANGFNKRFRILNSKNGLSQNNVFAILEDSRGFMWFGTRDGLNKYDGNKITIYRNNFNDSSSISNNFIRVLFEDSKNNIWIGTSGGGLNKYDPERDEFTHFTHDPNNLNSLSNNNVASIVEDLSGNLWIGTIEGGVCKYNITNNQFTNFKNIPNDESSISNNAVRAMAIDGKGQIWIGFWGPGGLNKLDPETGKFKRYINDPNDKNSIGSNFIRSILIDHDSIIWLGSDGGGLIKFNRNSNKFYQYLHHQSNNSISINVVGNMVLDKDHNLWISTENGGLNILNTSNNYFYNYLPNPADPNSINDISLYSIYKARDNNIWIGTYTGGVNIYFNENNLFEHYQQNILESNSLSNNKVLCFLEDDEGNIWIGTDGGGLNKFDPATNTFKSYRANTTPHSISSDFVVCLYQDSQSRIWVGTWGGGLNLFDPKKETFTNIFKNVKSKGQAVLKNAWTVCEDNNGLIWVGTYYGGIVTINERNEIVDWYLHEDSNTNSISQNDIAYILCDTKSNNIWIGTDSEGLDCFNTDSRTFTHHKYNPDNRNNSLANNNIICLHLDNSNNLWIGTNEGLSKYNSQENNFSNIRMVDGLASEFITGILNDQSGNLWISTKKGISTINALTGRINNFSELQGLQDNAFSRGAAYLTQNGKMLFGGINGFNYFDPKLINISPKPLKIYLTEFRIFNRPIQEIKDVPHPNHLKSLVLDYDDDFISLDFNALEFLNNSKIEYAYKLEGVDKDWVYIQNKKSATYTNLPAGKYSFFVKAKIHEHWGEEMHLLDLKITPPFWQTPIFILLCIILIIITLYAYIKWREKKLVAAKRNLEETVKERTNSIDKQRIKLEELNNTKDKLFSIIAHDLKSPFNTLIGFTELLNNNITNWDKDKIKNTVMHLHQSAKKVFNLQNNLLIWAKQQNKQIKYSPKEIKLHKIVQNIVDLYEEQLKEKELELVLEINEECLIYSDSNMLHTIIRNLINNAIKFSHKKGVISISHKLEAHRNVISISDTGTGIPEEIQETIFTTLIKTANGTANETGTGLGLLICMEFVKNHQGEIWFETEENEGTKFIFALPVKQ